MVGPVIRTILCAALLSISISVNAQYVDRTQVTKASPTSLTTLQNAATADGTGTPMDVSGYSSVSFVVTGTFDASFRFEGTVDGTNWFTLTSLPWDSGGFWNTDYSQAGSYVTVVGSLSQVRARVFDYVSGTITIKAVASLAFSTIANKGVEVIPSTAMKIIGSSGSAFDSSVGANPAPANQIVTGGVYNSTKPTLSSGQAVAVQVDSNGNQLGVVRDAAGNDRGANVDANNNLGVVLPAETTKVIGTVNISALPLQVSLTNTGSNATAVKVDNSAVTQPISASSLPLPTNAATSTKQSDGSQKTQVVDSLGNVVGSTANALDINIKSGNPTSITANAGTNLNTSALALSATQTDGTQKTRVTDGTNDVAVKAASTAAVATDNALVVAVSPNNIVPISAASLPLPSTAATSTKQSDGSQKTQMVDGSGNVIGSTGNALDINIKSGNSTTVQPVPGTTNGANTCVVQSAASTNATNCKNAAGLLYGIEVINTTSTIYYLRLYNLSTAPTCSSATGFVRTVPIPHASGSGAGIANFYTVGETYGTGIGFCLTGGGSSTDNSNAATGVYITLHYK